MQWTKKAQIFTSLVFCPIVWIRSKNSFTKLRYFQQTKAREWFFRLPHEEREKMEPIQDAFEDSLRNKSSLDVGKTPRASVLTPKQQCQVTNYLIQVKTRQALIGNSRHGLRSVTLTVRTYTWDNNYLLNKVFSKQAQSGKGCYSLRMGR